MPEPSSPRDHSASPSLSSSPVSLAHELLTAIREHGAALTICVSVAIYSMWMSHRIEDSRREILLENRQFLQETLVRMQENHTLAVQKQAESNALIAAALSGVEETYNKCTELLHESTDKYADLITACMTELRNNRIVMSEFIKQTRILAPNGTESQHHSP